MKKNSKSNELRERFLNARNEQKDLYFDADEIECLLDDFEMNGDKDLLYKDVLMLGLRLHPGNIDLQVRYCRFLFEAEGNAALALEKANQLGDTGNEDLDVLKIDCYINLNNFDEIKGILEKLIRNKATNLQFILEYMAPLLNDMEMCEEVIDLCERGLQMFPGNIILMEELCYALEDANRFEEAIRLCNSLIDKRPYDLELWFMLGRLYTFSENYDKAIDALKFALTCDDSERDIKLLLIYCLIKNENYDEATRFCRELLPEADNNFNMITYLGECLVSLNRVEEAYVFLKEQMGKYRLEDLDQTVWMLFLRVCGMTRRSEDILAFLDSLGALSPTDLDMDAEDITEDEELMDLSSDFDEEEDKEDEIINRLATQYVKEKENRN